jgi:hypothetical protein
MFSDMQAAREKAMRAAQSYLGTNDALELLGYGVSGFVFLSPTAMTAIKVHHALDAFYTEVKAYTIPNAHIVYSVQHQLRQIGIWYLDARQSNINLEGLPGLAISDPDADPFEF